MAGGRGLRLHPLTESRPKPLFNVGGKPVLEQIIEGFRGQGFRTFYLIVNYRAELIRKHFGDGSCLGVQISYVEEDQATPLGTAGGLRLLPEADGPLIVTNADVLARVDYRELLATHTRAAAQATVCLALHQHQLPYGVADFKDEQFVGIREKPIENILINAGIYVLERRALRALPVGPCDMPEFVGQLMPLTYYPIESAWFDLGNFIDLARANNDWMLT